MPLRRKKKIAGEAVLSQLAPVAIARLDVCLDCAWNVSDHCQHPGQDCPPCRQGKNLSQTVASPHFRCPLNLLPKLL